MLLLLYGNFCGNYFSLLYWHFEPLDSNQILSGIPLTPWATLWFLMFNTLCFLSLISHWRAAWADPGSIPKTQEPPGGMNLAHVKYCKKCDFNWKPERAHHCSECGTCVFKVRKISLTRFLDGSSLPLGE